jgi:hypothetical protein
VMTPDANLLASMSTSTQFGDKLKTLIYSVQLLFNTASNYLTTTTSTTAINIAQNHFTLPFHIDYQQLLSPLEPLKNNNLVKNRSLNHPRVINLNNNNANSNLTQFPSNQKALKRFISWNNLNNRHSNIRCDKFSKSQIPKFQFYCQKLKK